MTGSSSSIVPRTPSVLGRTDGTPRLSPPPTPVGARPPPPIVSPSTAPVVKPGDPWYFHPNGAPIVCGACDLRKDRQDPVTPGITVRWNTHGRSAATSHSQLDSWCEAAWKKQKYEMTLEQFKTWAHTQQGQHDLAHWTDLQIKARQQNGQCRFSDKWWAELPTPSKIKKETKDLVELLEPEDIWTSAAAYETAHGATPESVGIQCEWVARPQGKEWGFWTASDQPLKRQRKNQQSLSHETELDNSKDQLTSDQLSKRFAAEVASLNNSTGALTAEQLRKLQENSSAVTKADDGLPAPDAAPISQTRFEQASVSSAAPKKGKAGAKPKAGSNSVIKTKGKPGAKPSLGTGGGGGGGGGAQAGQRLSVWQMMTSKTEADTILHKFKTAETMDDVNACESDVVSVLKTLEGNKKKLSLMETMDAAMIDYQMDLQERLDHIITYKAVFSEYRKFKTPTKKGGAQPQSDALSQALKDLRNTCQVVPPVVVAVECELQSIQYLKDEEFDKYIGCLAAMQCNAEFITDAFI